MNSPKFESTLSKFLLIGPTFVSIFLVLNVVSDPVNAPKMVALGSLGFALGALFVGFTLGRSWSESKMLLISILLFVVAALNSILHSSSPVSQNLYGVYGRNTGFITYFSLVLVLLGALQVRKQKSLEYLIYGFFTVGIVNVFYCLWVLIFGDFIPWNNPYKKILGLLGNPDFISAFLGIFITALFSYVIVRKTSNWLRVGASVLTMLSFYEIIASHAIQGIAVTVFGGAIILFYVIRSRTKGSVILVAYLISTVLAGVTGILGTLQIGPLRFIYKKSVSLRGAYWHAGINMGNAHPFAGVGMDSYGDSYKSARPAVALLDTPGPKVITNAAHNVFIDIFSYGGWPLLLSYFSIFIVVGISIFRVTKRSRSFDHIFVTLTVIWATYLLQSAISINQIGLAIWGWVTSGSIIAYDLMTRNDNQNLDPKQTRQIKVSRDQRGEYVTPNLVAGIGMLVGLLIAVPPLSADLKWKSALDSRNISNVEAAMKPSYLNPPTSFKYGTVVSLLSENGFGDVAYKYAKIAVEFNPDFSDGWRQLYSLPQSSKEEKRTALINIKRLDPNNPDPLGLNP